jgi:hypothetical protein
VDVKTSEKDAKVAAIVRSVRGQQQHFGTKLEERRAPRSCRAQEQTMDAVQQKKNHGEKRARPGGSL